MAERTVFPGLIGNDRLRELFRSELSEHRIAHAADTAGASSDGRIQVSVCTGRRTARRTMASFLKISTTLSNWAVLIMNGTGGFYFSSFCLLIKFSTRSMT